MISPAHRMENLQPHFFAGLGRRIRDMVASGLDVIRLDEGSPDLPPPPRSIEALQNAARRTDTHGYQEHRGPRSLRQAWAEMYDRLYQVKLDADSEIIPLQGSKEGIFHFTLAFVDPGDVVLIPDPGYITYTRSTLFAGGIPHPLPLLAENDWMPDLDAIPEDIAARAKLIWLNYPNNPTTAVATTEFFAKVINFARQHNLLVCHDAAYSQVTFDGYRAPSILEVRGAREVAVEFNSLSKSHNLAGWRVGALIGRPDVLQSYFNLKTNADSSHFLPLLEGATAAMTMDRSWIDERNEVYRQRRDLVLTGLHALDILVPAPKASLYIWCPIPVVWSSIRFADDALEQAHVSLTPGVVFGQHGEGYVRISITAPLSRLEQAMERLSIWYRKAV
jgi:LL-diaminopimelate aminotransferase